MNKFPECNSEKIIKDAITSDRGDLNVNLGFTVAVDEKPDALMFKQRISSRTKAEVCADCGHIEFVAVSPDMLWAAYQNKLKNS